MPNDTDVTPAGRTVGVATLVMGTILALYTGQTAVALLYTDEGMVAQAFGVSPMPYVLATLAGVTLATLGGWLLWRRDPR